MCDVHFNVYTFSHINVNTLKGKYSKTGKGFTVNTYKRFYLLMY